MIRLGVTLTGILFKDTFTYLGLISQLGHSCYSLRSLTVDSLTHSKILDATRLTQKTNSQKVKIFVGQTKKPKNQNFCWG